MNSNKYFWDLSGAAIKETPAILKDGTNPKHISRVATLLSRCDKPGEVFSYMDKTVFINSWPKVKKYWKKTAHAIDFLEWWDMIYDEMTRARPKDKPSKVLVGIGNSIKSIRLEKGFNQQGVSDLTGLSQADISRIERGRNIKLISLIRILKVLKVREFTIKII
ncbi:MAG: helix-turn-helix transcriptional regulator [Elusimicrobiota bacterium]|nr:helix-turn-helix transcriptional regulator [Elusimicrobiota bacterium]